MIIFCCFHLPFQLHNSALRKYREERKSIFSSHGSYFNIVSFFFFFSILLLREEEFPFLEGTIPGKKELFLGKRGKHFFTILLSRIAFLCSIFVPRRGNSFFRKNSFFSEKIQFFREKRKADLNFFFSIFFSGIAFLCSLVVPRKNELNFFRKKTKTFLGLFFSILFCLIAFFQYCSSENRVFFWVSVKHPPFSDNFFTVVLFREERSFFFRIDCLSLKKKDLNVFQEKWKVVLVFLASFVLG